MANSIPKKRAKAEQLRKKRAQAASALAQGAKKSLKATLYRRGLAGRPVPRAGG